MFAGNEYWRSIIAQYYGFAGFRNAGATYKYSVGIVSPAKLPGLSTTKLVFHSYSKGVKDSNGKTYVTNESGTCTIKLDNSGKKVKITVTFVGYKSYISYVSAQTRTLNIKLKEEALQLSDVTVTSKRDTPTSCSKPKHWIKVYSKRWCHLVGKNVGVYSRC